MHLREAERQKLLAVLPRRDASTSRATVTPVMAATVSGAYSPVRGRRARSREPRCRDARTATGTRRRRRTRRRRGRVCEVDAPIQKVMNAVRYGSKGLCHLRCSFTVTHLPLRRSCVDVRDALSRRDQRVHRVQRDHLQKTKLVETRRIDSAMA